MTQVDWSTLEIHLSHDSYCGELQKELGSRNLGLVPDSGLVVAKRGLKSGLPIWAKNTWLQPQHVKFKSISDAAQILREMGALWCNHATNWHRRAALIQEKLPVVKSRRLSFLDPFPKRALGGWCLTSPETLLASPLCSSPFPEGQLDFVEDKNAPSRAYLKLWELFFRTQARPQKGDVAVDLGASPGGWTYVLLELGCSVHSFDRAPLAIKPSAASSLPQHQTVDAFQVVPKRWAQADQKQWLFSDIACAPELSVELMDRWTRANAVDAFVCTLKLKRGLGDHLVKELLRRDDGSKLIHLNHNKNELTWYRVPQGTN